MFQVQLTNFIQLFVEFYQKSHVGFIKCSIPFQTNTHIFENKNKSQFLGSYIIKASTRNPKFIINAIPLNDHTFNSRRPSFPPPAHATTSPNNKVQNTQKPSLINHKSASVFAGCVQPSTYTHYFNPFLQVSSITIIRAPSRQQQYKNTPTKVATTPNAMN